VTTLLALALLAASPTYRPASAASWADEYLYAILRRDWLTNRRRS